MNWIQAAFIFFGMLMGNYFGDNQTIADCAKNGEAIMFGSNVAIECKVKK